MGCRTKGAKSVLLRVVAVWDQGILSLAPDPGGRLPGRGASLHLDPRCVDLAEKRRAFPRALRLDGPVDVGPVRDHVEQHRHHGTDQHDQSMDQHDHSTDQQDQQDQHSYQDHSPHPPSDESGSTA